MTGGTERLVHSAKGNYGSGGAINVYVYYSSTQDVSANKSTVYVGMYVASTYNIGPWKDSGGSYVGTTSNTFNGAIGEFSGVKWLTENQSFTVDHNDEGKATATIYWKWGVNSPWGQCVYPSGSFTVDLPQIERESVITSVSNAYLGSPTYVVFTPKSSSFYYKVKIGLGTEESWSGPVYPGSTSVYTITTNAIPYSFANQIASPDVNATATATLYTYSDSACTNLVGLSTGYLMVSVPATNISMTLSPVNTPWEGLYVQGLCRVQASISATDIDGSALTNCKMSVQGASYDAPYLSHIIFTDGPVTVTGYAIDSRGETISTQQTINVIPYGKPRIVPCPGEKDIVCARCDGNGNFAEDGTRLRIKAMRSYSKVMSNGNQNNYCRMDYRWKSGGGDFSDWQPLISKTDTSDQIDVLLEGICTDVTASYFVQLRALDDVSGVEIATFTVSSAKVDFNFKEGGGGAAFGKYAETPNAVEVAQDWELIVYGDRWRSLGLNVNDSVGIPDTSVGAYGRVPAGECCYRVENGNHVYVAFSCSFNYKGMATHIISKNAIPEKYRPKRSVSTFCTCQGLYIVRVFVMQSGDVVIEYVQNLTSDTVTTNTNFAWVDGYIDYFITPEGE